MSIFISKSDKHLQHWALALAVIFIRTSRVLENLIASALTRIIDAGLIPVSSKSSSSGFFDFEYEFQMAVTNRKLSQDVETLFLMPSEQYSYFSSRLIKETAELGAELSSFVPAAVQRGLKEKLKIK